MEPLQQHANNKPSPTQWATPPRGELETYAHARSQESYVEVGHLLTQFQRASPVRTIAESLLGNSYRPEMSNLPLFTALATTESSHWREQVVAAWSLGRVQLNEEEKDAAAGMLLDTVERNESETIWERFLRGLLWGYGTMLPFCFLFSLLVCSTGEGLEWPEVFPKMLFTFGSLASVLSVPVCFFYGRLQTLHNNSLRAASAESLGRLKVIESIGTLAEGLFDTSQEVQEASSYALMEILPHLTKEDYGLFSHQAMGQLAEALNHPNSLIVMKVLEALEKVGIGQTLPAVERVAREGKTRRLQEMARQVIVVLEERRKREREARHLMRATHAPEQDADGLLRATRAPKEEERYITLHNTNSSPDDWV